MVVSNTKDFKSLTTLINSEKKNILRMKILSIISICISAFVLAVYISLMKDSNDIPVDLLATYFSYLFCSLIPSLLKMFEWTFFKKRNYLNKKELRSRIALSIFLPITSDIIALFDTKKIKENTTNKNQIENEKLNIKKDETQKVIEKLNSEITLINSEIERYEKYLISISLRTALMSVARKKGIQN